MATVKLKRVKNTFYFVTNLRAIIYQRYYHEIFVSVDFSPHFSMSFKPNSKGIGDIYFNTTPRADMLTRLENMNDNEGSTLDTKFRYTAKPFSACFLKIENAEEVFGIIKQASGYQDRDSSFDDTFDF